MFEQFRSSARTKLQRAVSEVVEAADRRNADRTQQILDALALSRDELAEGPGGRAGGGGRGGARGPIPPNPRTPPQKNGPPANRGAALFHFASGRGFRALRR